MSLPRGAVTFGRLLREYRLAAGLTQEVLADRSGVSPRTIQQLETGSVRPRRATAAYLAQALALSGHAHEELERAAAPVPRQRASRRPELPDGTPARPDILAVSASHVVDANRDHALVALPRPAPTNVPWPVSSLLGREADLAAIHDLITVNHQRLITLTGVGGSGKTRLAVQVAAELLSALADGVWFVELAPASNPALVPRIVAGVLGVREMPDAPILDTLLGFLRRKHLLLVLDNCEHLIDACAALADRLLTACPDLYILATSREPLRIAGERRSQVQPLAVPDLVGTTTLDALAAVAAVRLFVERAQATQSDFSLTAANAASVAQVCARLDGIPLAIELAASRIHVLAVDQIAERLDDCFRLLAGGTRVGSTRQQTMQAALDWSYDLLTASEQATFRRLSTFAGGFDLEAAEAVAGFGLQVSGFGREYVSFETRHPEPETLDVLGQLVDKSLVVAERTGPGRRYRLLEPVRQHAQRLLVISGENERARSRHATYYAALAERAAPLLRGPEQIRWLERLEAERDNLWAALAWFSEHGEFEDSLRLAVAMAPYWEAHGYLSEGRRRLETVLAAARTASASRVSQMRALLAAGSLALWQGDLVSAETLLSDVLASARDLADRHTEAEALVRLSGTYRQRDEVERGLRLGEEGLRLSHELADERLIAFALLVVGMARQSLGESSRAVMAFDEGVLRLRQLGDVRYAAVASTLLGLAMLEAGESDRAARTLREGLVGLKAVGDLGFIVVALIGLAHASRAQGELHRAAQLVGTAAALRTALAMRPPARDRASEQVLLASLREQLSASEFDEAYTAGEAMSLDQVFADVVATP
ncbi:MAG TPA: helix-turn-helix domain-containing protein [Chloroflexota bacterium]|nr:helix-turn-helix domain-containing protein [Chloroflexota bacterium]